MSTTETRTYEVAVLTLRFYTDKSNVSGPDFEEMPLPEVSQRIADACEAAEEAAKGVLGDRFVVEMDGG